MNKKSYILAIGMSILLIMLFITIIRSRPTGVASPSNFNLTPTAIPPDVLTRVAQQDATLSSAISASQTALPTQFAQYTQAAQTQQSLELTFAEEPTSDLQIQFPFFSGTPSADEILSGKSDYQLAGYGILYEDQVNGVIHKYWPNGWVWQESTYDSVILARGGYVLESPTQGVIQVYIWPHYSDSPYQNDVIIESPVQAGELTITGAVGERLIITSKQGQTFYFDVPALRFVDSLEESVPSATPPPTLDFPLEFTDDAPDEPADIYEYQYQLEETDLNYYINSPRDYDWFYFISQTEGLLKVSLVPNGKNYGLRVVLTDLDGNGIIVGEDSTSIGGVKQIIVPDAVTGNYMVRVWSLDGSYDDSQPYILRFDPPKPEKVIPILECVAENADGTFTAHFGYDNPNAYVVRITAEHDNAFHPNPVFRTEQPEYFAPGRIENWFRVLFDGNDLTWRLEGLQVTANRNSPRCP